VCVWVCVCVLVRCVYGESVSEVCVCVCVCVACGESVSEVCV